MLLSEDDDELLDSNKSPPETHISNMKTKSASVTTLKSVNPSELSSNSTSKLNRVHNQINEVIDGMKTNINKVLERGQELDDIDERSQQLSASATLFETRAKNTRKAMWFRTCRVSVHTTSNLPRLN